MSTIFGASYDVAILRDLQREVDEELTQRYDTMGVRAAELLPRGADRVTLPDGRVVSTTVDGVAVRVDTYRGGGGLVYMQYTSDVVRRAIRRHISRLTDAVIRVERISSDRDPANFSDVLFFVHLRGVLARDFMSVLDVVSNRYRRGPSDLLEAGVISASRLEAGSITGIPTFWGPTGPIGPVVGRSAPQGPTGPIGPVVGGQPAQLEEELGVRTTDEPAVQPAQPTVKSTRRGRNVPL